jgi:hypothetical protein
MNNSKKLRHFASAVAVGFALFLAFGSDEDQSESNSESTSSSTTKADPVKEQTPEELNEQLQREIASFNKPFDNKDYDGSVDAIQMEIILFSVWADIIKKGENSLSEDNIKLAQELKTKVANLQAKEFPILRKRYGKIVAAEMWEHDITIKTAGKNNTTLDLTGATFAANKNIKEFQTTLNEILTTLRFRQTRYRWYKGADEYTYFDLNVPSDKEPVTFTK